jgi:translation elongation factor P/translation initiation factor 5A
MEYQRVPSQTENKEDVEEEEKEMRLLTQEEDVIRMMDEEEADGTTVVDKILNRYPGIAEWQVQELLEGLEEDGKIGFWGGDWHLL